MDVSPTSPDSHQHKVGRRRAESESTTSTLSPRMKPVMVACERCRRRKIRCDGDTPCATCRRFSVACIRHRKDSNTQAVLEHRVRQLEEQIIQLRTNIPQGLQQESPMQRSTPPLHLVTDFEAPYQSALAGQPFGEVLQDSSPSNMDIPRIEIVDYAGASAASVPRDPSLQYATSDGSRPAFAALDWGLLPPNYSAMLSPPTSACSSPNYESVPYLSPPIPAEPASRRSSVSSLGLDYDGAPSIEIPGFIDEDGQTSQFETFPMFGDHLNTNDSPYNISPTSPTRFEMETLLDIFFDNAGVYGYRVDRGLFSAFLDVIGSPTPTGPYPVSMARFQVYMAIAIGMRVKMDGKTTDSQMLDNCYRLAMQQTESPHFWSQEGSVQAATLLVLFSRVSGV